ncbi:MAG: glycosyltransferase family 2 protein [Planctomycetes bacterium]|nr:glycosyltransferase family 2 protein [Planctomycetota bacterium]
MHRLSIILACFNEEESIEACLQGLLAAAPGAEIVVIHGGTDRTLEIARRLAAVHPEIRAHRNYGDTGKGHAIKFGIAVTERPWLLQFDADLQFDPAEVPRVLGPIAAGEADIVLGSRFLEDSVTREYRFSFLRVVGNRIVNRWLSWLAGVPISDVTTGYKAWTRAAIERVNFKDNGFVYEMEILLRGVRRGLRLAEVPITYRNREKGFSGHGSGVRERWSICRTGAKLLWRSLLIRLGLW